MTTFELVTTAITLLETVTKLQPTDRYFLAIAGIPGSGKTTLASQLNNYINELYRKQFGDKKEIAIALSMDGFHLTKKELSNFEDPVKAFARRGAPWTFNPEELLKKIIEVKNTTKSSVFWPSFDHAVGDPIIDDIVIAPNHQLIIIEGNYLLYNEEPWDQLTSFYQETWFLNCDLTIAQDRLINRHLQAGLESNYENALNRVKNNDAFNSVLIINHQQPPTKHIDIKDLVINNL